MLKADPHSGRKSFRRKIWTISTKMHFEAKNASQCPCCKMTWGLINLSQDLTYITERFKELRA